MEYEVPSEILPETTKYTLRAVIFQGSDIPVFRILNTQARKRKSTPSMTSHSACFQRCGDRKGGTAHTLLVVNLEFSPPP